MKSKSGKIMHKFFATLTLFAFINQILFVSYAAAMSDVNVVDFSEGEKYFFTNGLAIESALEDFLNSQPEIELGSDQRVLYSKAEYIDTDLFTGYQSLDHFKSSISGTSIAGEVQYVPIIVGDITTFVTRQPLLDYKHIGDKYVNTLLVRSQIRDKLGRNLITNPENPRYQTEREQYNTLINNAIAFAKNMQSLKYGDQYFPANYLSGPAMDMIWPELREINGEKVIVPIVHLTSATVREYSVRGNTVEFSNGALVGNAEVNGVDISLGRSAFMKAMGDLSLYNSSISSSGTMRLIAAGDLSILSSKVSANGDITLAGKSVRAETIVHRYDFGNETGTRYGAITSIDAESGNVNVTSYGDMNFVGASVNAGEGIQLNADGSIFIGSVQLQESFDGREGRWKVQRSEVDYLVSQLSASETISIIAKGGIQIEGADIVSDKGHIELLAGLGISVVDNVAQYQQQRKGKFGRKSVDESVYQTVAIRSVLDAGKGVKLHSDFGDITLRATEISSKEGTSVTAENGKVNLLVTRQQDHYSYSSVKEGLFTTTTRNKGHEITKLAPPTFIGGVKVNAAKGLTVEFEGDPNLSTEEQIRQLAQMEGLEYLDDLLDRNDVDFQEVEAVVKKWSKSNTSLSPAAIAVITIAVAVAAGPTAAGISSSIGGATGAAMGAAFTSLVSSATVSLANGNSIAATLDTLASEENLKSLAVTMVTAGAMAQLDAAFFEIPNEGDLGSLYRDPNNLSFTGQVVQATAHATTQAGIQSLLNGREFDEVFVHSLASNAQAKLGKFMANQIKVNWDVPNATAMQTAIRYIAHAGAGCILGGISAEVDNGGDDKKKSCQAGAGGAVVGEIIGDIHKSATKVGQDAEKLERFLAENGLTDPSQLTGDQIEAFKSLNVQVTAEQLSAFHRDGVDLARLGAALGAFISGADASQVNIAATTGQNAAENNALFLIPVAIGLLKAIDLALTADELLTLHADIQKAREEGGTEAEKEAKIKQLLANYFIGKGEERVEEAALEKLAEKILPGGTTFRRMLGVFQDQDVIDQDTIKNVTSKLGYPDSSLKDPDLPKPLPDGYGIADDVIADLPDGHRQVIDPNGNTIVLNARNQEVPTELQHKTASVDSGKGTADYDVRNNPPPNTRVELDNGTVFKTNSGGFVDEISYQPVNEKGTRDSRQTAVGKEGIAGDVGGHIQACSQGGSCDRYNLFPQNSNFNNSAYKKWENKIANALKDDGQKVGKITIKFERSNPNNVRPDQLRIEYDIDGEILVENFENIAGGGK
jgi:hypothetical protein